MKKSEIKLLSREDIEKKLWNSIMSYTHLQSKYTRAKADLIIIKLQLQKITDSIMIGCSNKPRARITYEGENNV